MQMQGPYTAEKNVTMLDHIVSGRMQEALEVLESPGFPVDPNCCHHWRTTKSGWHCGGMHTTPRGMRHFGEVKEKTESALVLAVRCAAVAGSTWTIDRTWNSLPTWARKRGGFCKEPDSRLEQDDRKLDGLFPWLGVLSCEPSSRGSAVALVKALLERGALLTGSRSCIGAQRISSLPMTPTGLGTSRKTISKRR